MQQLFDLIRKLESTNQTLRNEANQRPIEIIDRSSASILADCVQNRSDVDHIKYLQEGANILERAQFARTVEKIAVSDNYRSCVRALRKRSADHECVTNNGSDDFISKLEWRFAVSQFIYRNKHRNPVNVSKLARYELCTLWSKTKSIDTYHSRAQRLFNSVFYAYEVAEETFSNESREFFVDDYIRGLPNQVKNEVSTKAVRTRFKGVMFDLNDANDAARQVLESAALAGQMHSTQNKSSSPMRAPLNAVGNKRDRGSPSNSVCEFFLSGNCLFDKECKNAHPDGMENTAKRSRPSTPSKKVCYRWQNTGSCHFGENCRFVHAQQEQKQPAATTQPAAASTQAMPYDYSKPSCKKCHKQGHTAENCPHKDRTCNRCQAVDHFARDCPVACKGCGAAGGKTCTINCPTRPTFRKSQPPASET